MNSSRLLHLVALAFLVSGCATTPNHALAPAARTLDGGREVLVTVAQGEIKTNINKSNVAAAGGGGLLLALVDVGIEQHRATVAETAVAPLRNALIGFDFDSEVQSQTKATLNSLDWFGAQRFSFAKELTSQSRANDMAHAQTKQVAFFDYDYGVSIDFDAIELHLTVTVADKQAVAQNEAANKLPYQQKHKVVIPLRGAAKDKDENVRHWAADNAALAKRALEDSLRDIQGMVKQGLTQSADAVAKMAKSERVTAGAYSGTLIDYSNGATTLWNSVTDEWVMVTSPIG
jgi:hypothetical protein